MKLRAHVASRRVELFLGCVHTHCAETHRIILLHDPSKGLMLAEEERGFPHRIDGLFAADSNSSMLLKMYARTDLQRRRRR